MGWPEQRRNAGNRKSIYAPGLVLNIDPKKHENFYYSADGNTFSRCTDNSGNIINARVNKIVCPVTGKVLITPTLVNALNLSKDVNNRFYLTHNSILWVYTINGVVPATAQNFSGAQDYFVVTYTMPNTVDCVMTGRNTGSGMLARYQGAFRIAITGTGKGYTVPTTSLPLKVRSILNLNSADAFGLENYTIMTLNGTYASGEANVLGFTTAGFYSILLYGLQIYTGSGIRQDLGIIINKKAMAYYGIS